ncbi:MAG: SIMPL domain-containing protein [Gaiellaceae bacterium]
MRRLLFLALVAAAVLAAAALAGIGRPEAARGDTASPDTVTTHGHGVVTVVPDEATVTAGAQTRAATAAAALAVNAKLMDAVAAALKAAGGTGLQTQQVSLYPQTNEQSDVVGYLAEDSMSARTKIAGAGALIDAAVAAGANTVSGPALDVSDRDALYRDALAKAVADAHRKAEALAQAGGFAVGAASTVTEGDTESTPVRAFAALAQRDAATPIEPGTQDIAADVTVSFRMR